MWKKGIGFSLFLVFGYVANAQVSNSFNVSDNQEFDKIKFSLHATEGQCLIEPGIDPHKVDVHRLSEDASQPQYNEKIVNRTKHVSVELKDEQKSLSSSISRRMFSKQSLDDYTWKVYLSKVKPLDLDLSYAVGDTYINLSGLPIQNLKMRTGSANVQVAYKEDDANLLEMDTFLIKVDMGTFRAKNLHLSRSRHVIADVGFGTVHMDFKDARSISTDVTATVGAGKLEVLLPSSNVPVKININDSPLCHIKIPKEFQSASKHEFVNRKLDNETEDYLTFNVDVAVGNIVFRAVE